MKKNGDPARYPDLIKFAQKHQLKIISMKEIIEYRTQHDPIFIENAKAKLPTEYTDFDLNEKNARLYDLCYLCTGALASGFDNLSKRKKSL